jgi:AraC-like DNA-binding protein
MSITQIAYRWGFNDAAHFSRSFREAYNTSPRNVRKQGGVNPEAAQLVATI